MSILTVRASSHFPYFNFIFTSVSELQWGMRYFLFTFPLFKVFRLSSVLTVSFRNSSLEADRQHWLAFALLSSSGFIFRTCESCQFIPKAWKIWEEKKLIYGRVLIIFQSLFKAQYLPTSHSSLILESKYLFQLLSFQQDIHINMMLFFCVKSNKTAEIAFGNILLGTFLFWILPPNVYFFTKVSQNNFIKYCLQMYQKLPKMLHEWTIDPLHESEMEFVWKAQFLLQSHNVTKNSNILFPVWIKFSVTGTC